MRVFGYSVFTLFLFAVIFIIGAKWGGGIVAQIPVINSL